MKICGIEIPDAVQCKIKNWPFGTDLSVIARMIASDNCTRRTYYLTELSSEIPEEKLLTEEFSIKFLSQTEEGAMAEVTSGKFIGALLFLKLKKI